MLPYIAPPSWKIGPLTPHAFGALVVAAVLIGKSIVQRRSRRRGFAPNIGSALCIWMLGFGFAGAHLGNILMEGSLRTDPLVLFRLWDGLYSFGGIAGAMAGALCFRARYRVSRDELWRLLDVIAYAFPFAWLFGRLGCAIVHDHPGIPTTNWLGVQYPGGARFDLGLLEFLFSSAVAGVFLILDRRDRPAGFYLGLFLVLYGPFRWLLDGLHVEHFRSSGWPVDTFFSWLATLAGVLITARTFRMTARATFRSSVVLK